jgi:hypothetical protein
MEGKIMTNETESLTGKEVKEQYQIDRAKEYLKNHGSKNGSEDTLEYCIISDLLRIMKR